MSESDNIVVAPRRRGEHSSYGEAGEAIWKANSSQWCEHQCETRRDCWVARTKWCGKDYVVLYDAGLVVPNEGHVYIDDQEITNFPVYKRARAGIGYLPQEASVFRKMSVEDNIMSVLEMTKLSKQERIDKMESLIREFRLEKVRKNLGDRLLVVSVVAAR